MKKLLSVFVCLISASFAALSPGDALAQTSDYYGGINMRQGMDWISPVSVSARFDSSTPLGDAGFLFPTPQSYRIKFGYDYSRSFALQAEYFSKSRLPAVGRPLVPPGLSGLNTGAFSMDAVGMLPFWYRFAVLGKAGIRRLSFDGDSSPIGGSGLANAHGTLVQGKLGLGLQYNFSTSLGFRAEVERYRTLGPERNIADTDVDAVSFGLMYRF